MRNKLCCPHRTEFEYLPQQFTDCTVEWGDVISKMSEEFEDGTFKILNVAESLRRCPAPTFVLMNDFYSSSEDLSLKKIEHLYLID